MGTQRRNPLLAGLAAWLLPLLLFLVLSLVPMAQAQPAAGGDPDAAADRDGGDGGSGGGGGGIGGMTPEELAARLVPYTAAIGGVVMVLGVLLAFAGKRVLRLYLAVLGFFLGAVAAYVVLERVAASRDLGPNKDVIELVVIIVAGIIGIGLGLLTARLAVVALGALFGLALTVGVLTLPGTKHFREQLPTWGLVLILIAVSILIIWLLEPFLFVAFTAVVGALATAVGLDAILRTGFNQEVIRTLTSPDPDPLGFQGTKEMYPVLYAFVGVLVLGSLFQVCTNRRAGVGCCGAGGTGGGQRKASARREGDIEEGGATARLY